ncbi:hypothetical protein [Mycobacterium sp. E3305]|uniref:hypothetical protein n=1 Tax=Mycobacterium sp. E3305 TaxID=1834145 RepID=UPI0012E9056F|nr:hypothetical protein [Mycobacterium sp. E3305]
MSDLDPQSDDLCSAIEARLDRFAKTMSEDNATADRYRQLLADHQPEGGRRGAPCTGTHPAEIPWPCRQVRRLNQTDTYPTSVHGAARWLDVVQRMRDMIAATIPQAIDNIEHQLQTGGPNAEYNRRFAFSAFTMPFTYAIAATPPRIGSEVEAAIAPLNRAVDNLLTDPDVRTAMSQLEATMTTAEEELARLVADPEPASVTELVDELQHTVKVSMLAALVGAAGIVELADAEFATRMEELKYPPPQSRWVELAREPVAVVGRPTDTTVSIEEVYQAAAPGVQGMLQAMRGEVSPPRKTEVQRIQGAQWISFIFAEWNDHYRFELAKVWDCSHRDYTFPFFGELAKIRNDFIHNDGVAKRATANCQILGWFNEGEQMFLTPAMYVDVVRSWPWDELLHEPTPCQDSRNPYPGRAPVTLIDAIQRAAAADGIKPDDVLEEALQLWLQRSGG